MKKRILISGGNGEFAKELQKWNTSYDIISPHKNEMNVVDVETLDSKVFYNSPDYFIHAGVRTIVVLYALASAFN